MTFQEFKERIEREYHNKFGRSYCGCNIYKCLGKSITIDCRLAENTGECPNGISGNDMMKISFAIRLPDGWSENDDLPENLTMEAWSNCIAVKSTSRHLYCECMKVGYRKTSGDAEKLIKAFGKFVDRLYSLVVAEYEADNLLDFSMELVKGKRYF